MATKKAPSADDLPTTNPPRLDALPSDAVAGEPGGASAQQAVREVIDAETAAGYRGVKGDPTPRKNYTLAGVNANLPTPETIVRGK